MNREDFDLEQYRRRRKSYEWLDSWRASYPRSYHSRYGGFPVGKYSRRFSLRLAYRFFLISSSLAMIALLSILSLRSKPSIMSNNLYISSADSASLVVGSQGPGVSNVFATDPKTNRPLAGVKAKSYYIAPFRLGSAGAFEYNPNKILPIASITKLITAAVATELMSQDTIITISKSALATEGNNGSFKIGDKVSLGEILYPLLMVSSNDAAEAISERYGRANFIRAMNSWAWKIGAFSTNFEDPTGLSPQNLSTAADLAKIIRYIEANHPELLNITALKIHKFGEYTWTNPTNFLNMSSYGGGKNGFTNEAAQTSVAIFSVQTGAKGYGKFLESLGRKVLGQTDSSQILPAPTRFLIIVLDSPTRDRDVLTLLKYIE